MSNQPNTPSNVTPLELVPGLPMVDFGAGKYSKIMLELYRDAFVLLKLTPKEAELAARSYGADLGRLQTHVQKVTLGRVTKSTETLTLRESAMIKGVPLWNSIRIAKLCVALAEVWRLGIKSYTRPEFQVELTDWLAGKEKPAAKTA